MIRHASHLDESDYYDIASTVDALTESGDITLVPRLHEALDRFLDEENFYGRDTSRPTGSARPDCRQRSVPGRLAWCDLLPPATVVQRWTASVLRLKFVV